MSQIGYEEYLEWRRQFPVGYLLAKQIEKNKQLPVRKDLYELHEEERRHIADPLSYVGTKPDVEVRYKEF